VAAPPLKEAEEQVRVKVEKEKRIRGKVRREEAKKLSKKYNKQSCYLLLIYDPQVKTPIDAIPVRTQPTLESVLKDLEELGLYPLIHPQRVYVPQSFWEEYRLVQSSSQRLELVRKYELLKDSSIYCFDTIVIDIDSPFESVYPVWNELRERLALNTGYQVYKTKSGRFRAYIYLLDGTKDLRRAKELVAIIYAFFESKGLNSDETFVYRLNHPVFYEDFPLYSYELIEDVEGKVPFFRLYRKAKELQKELKLYTFKGKNLTEEIWGKKPPAKREKKECRIIKAPAFIRKLEREKLDVFELWKRAVTTLSQKHTSYRYIYVIQPAVGWAKYLELPEDEVTEFLVGLLGEPKRKDIEKGWKYVRELEFTVPESVKWAGKTREEWEGEVIAYLQFREEVSRQELLKEVFANQKWLCDMIMDGLVSKRMVTFDFVVHGRGRPRKVYRLAEEVRIPLRKAVGCEEEIFYLINNQEGKIKVFQGTSLSREEREDFSQYTNSPERRAMGGGWVGRWSEGVYGGFMGEWKAFSGGVGSSLRQKSSYQFSSFFDGGGDDDGDVLVQLWEVGLIDF
jgi:hypothetical protein